MNKKDFLEQSQQFLKAKGIKDCTIGIVLGTGLDGLSNEIVIERDVPYEEIPHFPKSTMPYHKARLLYGSLNGQKVMVFEGRFHAYEGLNFFEITYSIRLMHAMGVKTVIISNAAGALNLEYHKGEVMLITDHINLQGGSPL
ncbi:MAG: purine-nucleoside phosphorylase, partial [Flavobacteriaceae bacterium]